MLGHAVFDEILPGQICPRPHCGALVGVDVPAAAQPLRWVCVSGHSGYFHTPSDRRVFPPGARRTANHFEGQCRNCGNPTRKPKSLCVDCRRPR